MFHGTHQVQLIWCQAMTSNWCLMLEGCHSHLHSTWWHPVAGTVEAIVQCRVWCLKLCTPFKCVQGHQLVQVCGAYLLPSLRCLLVSHCIDFCLFEYIVNVSTCNLCYCALSYFLHFYPNFIMQFQQKSMDFHWTPLPPRPSQCHGGALIQPLTITW